MPAGTVSLPMPSPGMTAMRCVLAMLCLLATTLIVSHARVRRGLAYRCARDLDRIGRLAGARARGRDVAMERRALERLGMGADRCGLRAQGLDGDAQST